MRNATIVVVRLKGVATEAIKNIVLAGIGKLIVVDADDVAEEDLGAGFFFRDEDVGKKVRDRARPGSLIPPRSVARHSAPRALCGTWMPKCALCSRTPLSVAHASVHGRRPTVAGDSGVAPFCYFCTRPPAARRSPCLGYTHGRNVRLSECILRVTRPSVLSRLVLARRMCCGACAGTAA